MHRHKNKFHDFEMSESFFRRDFWNFEDGKDSLARVARASLGKIAQQNNHKNTQLLSNTPVTVANANQSTQVGWQDRP